MRFCVFFAVLLGLVLSPSAGTTDTTTVLPPATTPTRGNITTTTVTPAATTTTKPSSGKIFPGTITLAGTYPKDIETVNSSLYQQMSENLTAFVSDFIFKLSCIFNALLNVMQTEGIRAAFKFEAAFNLTDYKQTVIVKVHVTTGNTRSENSGVSITVMNIFEKNTNETTETVIGLIMAEANRSNSVYLYSNTSHCAVFDCDSATTECQESDYPECKCKDGLSKTAWDDRSCSDCSSDCSANNNKYCAKANGVPRCYCMTNFKEEGEKCVSCPVGYSGQNCENNFELILIIVGTVLGAIILCLVVAVSVVSVRAKHSKDPEKKSLIKPGHSNPDTSSETRIFPRVQTTSGHGNPGYQPNPYEARSSNRNRFLDGDYDDVVSVSYRPMGTVFLDCGVVGY
ncbi:Mucin-13 [Anas platyrhynchos]|uniref:Mucin-13 n=1 Tax=Anas platyrhynchos TaxID=8839 RepID=R0LAX2_ANAPL|nr:Mucin-13 [Anas platyrhynchos]